VAEAPFRPLRRLPARARRVAFRVLSTGGSALELALRWARTARTGAPRGSDGPEPVTFLVWNAYSLGGTVRTVTHQANALSARGHDVEVVGVERREDQSHRLFFPLDPQVRLTTLVDLDELRHRRGLGGTVARWLHERPSVLIHPREGRAQRASLLTDLRLVRALSRVRNGVVIGTRLGLNLLVARFAHPGATSLAQEHLSLGVYRSPLTDGIRRHFPKLDAVAALTAADAAHYRRYLGDDAEVLVTRVPNSVPDELPRMADPGARRIVAVGHLTARGKGMDRLVPAFARIAAQHPDWELRLVGAGAQEQIVRQAEELGVRDRVTLTGPSDAVAEELSAASVLCMPSRAEAFSLVLIEGMAAGLAVASFDCREGPRDILTPGVDGLVVPQGDLDAFAAALDTLLRDEELRRRLGRNARRTVEDRYLESTVTDRWLEVFDAAERGGGPQRAGSNTSLPTVRRSRRSRWARAASLSA
jgi:glycosyltransferase involved in cell wall biosynthesis